MKYILTVVMLCLFFNSYAQIDTTAADTIDYSRHEVHSTLNNNDRFTVGITIGADQSFRTVKSEKYNELAACREEHESAIVVPEIGLTIGYRFDKNLQIISGLTYFQSGFDFNEDRTFSDTLTHELGVGCDVDNVVDPSIGYIGIGFWDSRFGFVIDGLHPNHGKLTVKPRYHYLEIPLLAQYRVGKNKLQGFAGAGASVNYMFYQTIITEVASDGSTYASFNNKGTPWDIYRQWNFSALTRLGMDYRLSESISIGVEFAARYQILNLFGKSWTYSESYEEHHYNAGIKLSVAYHF